MTREEIQTSINSYNARLGYERQRAYTAIIGDDFVTAAMAVAQAAVYKGAIDELEFQLEAMEAEA